MYNIVYRLDLLNNHVAVIAVVQCLDHEGLQFCLSTVACATVASLSVYNMIFLSVNTSSYHQH